MRPSVSPILEAAYCLDEADQAWVESIVAAARPCMDCGLGVCGYLYDLSVRPVRAWACVAAGTPLSDDCLAASMASTSADCLERTLCSLASAAASEVPGYEGQPVVRDVLEGCGIADFFCVNGYDPPTRRGVLLAAPLPSRHRTTRLERAKWSRVAAHLAAAVRLRRRVAAADPVLTPDGETAHGDGHARVHEARKTLALATRDIERARGTAGRPDAIGALARSSIAAGARWSLVDQFESDGKRYVVARVNDARSRGPEALSARERQVLGFAARGHSSKRIGYELGISSSTVRVLLARAARKLGMRDRVGLLLAARRLGLDPES